MQHRIIRILVSANIALVSLLTWAPTLLAQTAISADGAIESRSEGFLFPDGSIQTTAAFPELGFLFIEGEHFRPDSSNASYAYYSAGCMYRSDAFGTSYFTHNVQLPQGATIDYLRVYYYDNDSDSNVTASLRAYDGQGGSEVVASVSSSGAQDSYRSTGSGYFDHTVDNIGEALTLAAYIPGSDSTLQLCGMRLRYSAPSGTPAAAAVDAVSSDAQSPIDRVVPEEELPDSGPRTHLYVEPYGLEDRE